MAETGGQLLEEKQVSTRELLNRSAQDLIEEVNAKRKRDSTLLAGPWFVCSYCACAMCLSADFKRAMERQCSNTCNGVETAMYNIYEMTNKSVEEKLQELSTVLERIGTTFNV